MKTDLIIYIVGILIAAVPVLIKCYRIYKDSKDWKKIGKIGLDFIEHQLAGKNEKVVHVQKKQLQTMQDIHGVSDRVDNELKLLRAERKKIAEDKSSSIELHTDIDPLNGQWLAGAKWRKTF